MFSKLSNPTQDLLRRAHALINEQEVETSSKDLETRLYNLPEDLLLQALMPEGKAHLSYPYLDEYEGFSGKRVEIRKCPLFQTSKQLRDLVLRHHHGLVVNIPAEPRKATRITTDEQYWHQFQLGCQSLKKALDTATEQNIAHVGLAVQNITNAFLGLPTPKPWVSLQRKLDTEGVGVARLRILKVDGMHLPDSFFFELAQSMPSLQNITLTKCQLEVATHQVFYPGVEETASLPLQHLSMIDCCLKCNQRKQKYYIVSPEHIVSFPKLTSFVYVNEHARRYHDHSRCPWHWLLSSARQLTSLTLQYESLDMEQWEVRHLAQLEHLQCVNLDVPLTDSMMTVLLQLPSLQCVQLRVGNELKTDFSTVKWPIKQLVVSNGIICQELIEAMSRMPLDCIEQVEFAKVHVYNLREDQLPQFLALALRVAWSANCGSFFAEDQRLHKAATLLLPYINQLHIKELALDSELARALAQEAQHRKLTISFSGYPPLFISTVLPVLDECYGRLIIGPGKPCMQP